jgi:hypothetical protein
MYMNCLIIDTPHNTPPNVKTFGACSDDSGSSQGSQSGRDSNGYGYSDSDSDSDSYDGKVRMCGRGTCIRWGLVVSREGDKVEGLDEV